MARKVFKIWSLDNFDEGYVNKTGRFVVKFPEHPRAGKTNGHIFRSIVAYEAYWNIQIPKGFVIHHIDRNKSNDSKENLQLMKIGDHVRLHLSERDYKKQNSKLKNGKTVKCANCGKEIYKAKCFLKGKTFAQKNALAFIVE